MQVPSLTLDLRTGRVALVTSGLAPMPDDCPTALGVIGMLRMEMGAVLALITKAKRVCAAICYVCVERMSTRLIASCTV